METTKPTFAAAQPDAARATLFRNVYLWMTMALALTALTAYTVAGSETLLQAIFSSRFVFLGLIVAELVLVFVLAANIMRMSFLTATLMFIAYSVVNGATLSTIFLVYDLGSIGLTFLVTAGMFGAMSLYGFVTGRDLSSWGNLLTMALVGVILASVVNLFLRSEMLMWIVTYVGILLFVGLTAYDTYKGYTQQQWENEFAREQWEYNKERTGQSDALNAYEQAFNLYQQGAGDAANAVLGRYGLDTGIFDNYSGAPITRADKAGALTTAAGLAGGGSDEAARAVLELYGLDPNSVGNYRTIAGRQLATTLATKSAGGSGSSSGRRSSGTKGSGSSWTNSQLQSMAKTFSSMKGNEPLYDFYKQTLTDNGWLNADTANVQSASQSGGVDMAAMLAKNYAKKGYSAWAIMNNMNQNGYSDEEIARALEKAGVKG